MISVVIPMYNSSATIVRCLDSVVHQTYQATSYEVIIINDGSSDGSKEIVEGYINKMVVNNYEFMLISQPNGGVSKARNAGLKIAKGDYIALLDADDAWNNNKITSQINVFQKLDDSIDFLATAFDEIYLGNEKEDRLLKIEFKNLVFKNYFQPSTVMFKKKVLKTIGYFREDQKYAEEGNYFMRIAYQFNCYFLNSKLIEYGEGKSGFGESGLSANLKEMEKGELMNLKYIYENKMINVYTYMLAYCYSILKYLRRILIVKFR